MAVFASASSSRVKYDVFISFQGQDVRFGFVSHLTRELREKQVDIYVDEVLERGDDISSALEKAIEESKISLVIFSKNYAHSKWCLQELVKIMDRREASGQIVLPVFYDVDPSAVRHQKGTYADAFTHLERKFKDNSNELEIWRYALKKTADLSGYSSSHFQCESDIIDAIVTDVLKRLDKNHFVHDVFISFRGPDARFSFVSHLTKELRRKKLDVYVDDRLERGDEMWPALEKAIEGSKIALVIFSKNYAFSTWCLRELVKIMDRREASGQFVLPVFYGVAPSDVRHQKGTYADAFRHLEQRFKDDLNQLPIWSCVLKIFACLFGYHSFNDHEQRFKDNMGKLKTWRFVLEKTAGLTGVHSSEFREQTVFIDAILEDVLKLLRKGNFSSTSA